MSFVYNMSDAAQKAFCHNCGDPVSENTIYCDSCSYVETDDSAGTNGAASEKTWDDIKDTRSGNLALWVQFGMLIGAGITSIASVLALLNTIVFGAPSRQFWLLIGVSVVWMVVLLILSKTWTAFRLLGNE